jgi:L-threonylcarbamoyladenylate synthase
MIVLSSIQDPQLIELLHKGAVGVVPTDTIYGLCAHAANHAAVRKLYALKQYEHKPGTLIAANIEQLAELGVDKAALQVVAHLWPNALSIILPAADKSAYLHQGLDSLAVRIPKDEALCKVLLLAGPLLTTGANHPGEPAANNLEDAQRYFGDEADFYVEGGDRSNWPPSTVARLTGNRLEVTRPGAVVIDENEILL